MTETPVPSFSDVLAARDRIGALTRLTPLVESEALNRRFGGRLLVKLEPLQVGAVSYTHLTLPTNREV